METNETNDTNETSKTQDIEMEEPNEDDSVTALGDIEDCPLAQATDNHPPPMMTIPRHTTSFSTAKHPPTLSNQPVHLSRACCHYQELFGFKLGCPTSSQSGSLRN
jgi:hypothetical protein